MLKSCLEPDKKFQIGAKSINGESDEPLNDCERFTKDAA